MYFRIGDSWGPNVALEKWYYQSFVTNIRRQLVQKLISRIVKRPNIEVYETLCAFWCHLYHLKNAKNTLLGLLLLTKLQADWRLDGCFNIPQWVYFLVFLNCTNATKLRKEPPIDQIYLVFILIIVFVVNWWWVEHFIFISSLCCKPIFSMTFF